jgi:hypothetical protein
MRVFSPKRRTALVLAGTGSSGAYLAGVLKALDERVKITSSWAPRGRWPRQRHRKRLASLRRAVSGRAASWRSFYRLRPALRTALWLLGVSFGSSSCRWSSPSGGTTAPWY